MNLTPFVWILAILFCAVLVIGAVWLYVYWWLLQRPNPKLNGTVTAPFLAEPVEIRRDKHGVPHVYAASEADLFRTQGWLHAQDRFWQLEQGRRIAQGRLAEVFGAAALEADRFSRVVGFQRAAEAELARLDPETRQVLAWYAEGVNAYIASRPGRLSGEINLLRVAVDPWRPADSLAVAQIFAWSQSVNWEHELTRALVAQHLDPYTATGLEPDYPAKNPIALEGVGSQEQLRLISVSGLLLGQYEELRRWLGSPAEANGSNSWVLAPKHSLNRRPLLCADPHFNAQLPTTFYEAHLAAADYEASGATIPGLPGVYLGHNLMLAWGVTNALVDSQDLYLERSNPTDPTLFQFGAAWEQAQVLDETIHVRRAEPVRQAVVITRHGPLISELVRQAGLERALAMPETLHLALRWTGAEAGSFVAALLRLNRASTWQEVTAAAESWVAPAVNISCADARGNIGFVMAGAVPRRTHNLGLVPAAGWDGAHEWDGFIPAAELPRLYNPESGKIVLANHKIVGDDYPYFLGADFDPGWRAARIEEMLAEKDRHTIRDMEEMQLDNVDKLAQAFTPWFTLLRSEDPWEKVAIQALRKWNWRMDSDNPAGLIYSYLMHNLLELVYAGKLGAAQGSFLGASTTPLFPILGSRQRAETALLQIINEHEESFWYADVAKRRARTRDELLQEALTRSMKLIRRIYGDSMLRWAWGKAHQVRFVHPLSRARFVGGQFDRGPLPVGGDGMAPNLTAGPVGLPPGLVQTIPVYRQIYEVGTWDRAESVLAGGQAGHALSRLYDDQIMMWREGAYHVMPWSREAVEKVTEHRLVLQPA